MWSVKVIDVEGKTVFMDVISDENKKLAWEGPSGMMNYVREDGSKAIAIPVRRIALVEIVKVK